MDKVALVKISLRAVACSPTNYHSINLSYSSVNRGWCNTPICCYSTKGLRHILFQQLKKKCRFKNWRGRFLFINFISACKVRSILFTRLYLHSAENPNLAVVMFCNRREGSWMKPSRSTIKSEHFEADPHTTQCCVMQWQAISMAENIPQQDEWVIYVYLKTALQQQQT
jgi:hypothetical protein